MTERGALSPSQRIILARAARLGIVQTTPTQRVAAIALVMRGYLELTPAGLVITDAGRAANQGMM